MSIYNCKICGRKIGFDGVCYECSTEQERNRILLLGGREIEDILNSTLDKIDDSYDFYDSDYELLMGYRGIYSQEIARKAAENGLFDNAYIYYNAPDDAVDILINELENAENSINANNILCCLAMTNSPKAVEVMRKYEKIHKDWQKDLYVLPSVYAECGGWTFDEKTVYPLVFSKCLVFEKSDSQKPPARIFSRLHEKKCPCCGEKPVELINIDCDSKIFSFLGIKGKLTATACLNCIAWGNDSFYHFDEQGNTSFIPSPDTEVSEDPFFSTESYAGYTNNMFALQEKYLPLFYGAFTDILNTVGGYANWVQDFEHRTCPKCGKKMKYLAQIQLGTFCEFEEGTVYIEVCPDCRITDAIYQQT